MYPQVSEQNNNKVYMIIGACVILALLLFWMYQSSTPVVVSSPTPTPIPSTTTPTSHSSTSATTPASAFSFESDASFQPAQQLSSTGTIYTLVGSDVNGNIADTTIQTDKKNVKVNGEFEVVNASGTRLLHISNNDGYIVPSRYTLIKSSPTSKTVFDGQGGQTKTIPFSPMKTPIKGIYLISVYIEREWVGGSDGAVNEKLSASTLYTNVKVNNNVVHVHRGNLRCTSFHMYASFSFTTIAICDADATITIDLQKDYGAPNELTISPESVCTLFLLQRLP